MCPAAYSSGLRTSITTGAAPLASCRASSFGLMSSFIPRPPPGKISVESRPRGSHRTPSSNGRVIVPAPGHPPSSPRGRGDWTLASRQVWLAALYNQGTEQFYELEPAAFNRAHLADACPTKRRAKVG